MVLVCRIDTLTDDALSLTHSFGAIRFSYWVLFDQTQWEILSMLFRYVNS